ncbi:hypothetical protein N185_36135 [Sinorhizobium sp. GW3]|nr:hypothetical protein N185_36135 [Sinorhizobium sp. GW3]
MSNNIRYLPPVGRLLISMIFLVSGFSKITNAAMIKGYIASAGLPLPELAYLIAVVVEIGGGFLLLVGFRSRIVAGLLAAFCIVTAFAFHADLADQIQSTNFLKNIAIAGGLLQIVAFGSGALSVDGRGTSDHYPAA